MKPRLFILPLLAATAGTSAAGPKLQSVPFVGCAADGQTGPVKPPNVRATPRFPAAVARRLAYYAVEDTGVLAPVGWHCFETYGSGGSTLYVTPTRYRSAFFFDPKRRLAGDAVIVAQISGETSGRFAVADVAAGLFPIAKDFVREVRAEGLIPVTPARLTAADRIVARTATSIDVVTAPGAAGLGTGYLLTPSRHAARRAYFLRVDQGMSLTSITVRLAPENAALANYIIHDARKD